MAQGPVLLGSLGTGNLDCLTYSWKGRPTLETRYVPVALWHALKPRPQRVLILLTDQARKMHWLDFQEEMAVAGGPTPEPIDIDDGEDHQLVFKQVIEALEGVEEAYLDITFSFRYLAFLYFAALAYLRGFRSLKLRGVYYGRREDGQIVDATHLVALTDGYYAVRAFRESGNLKAALAVLRQQANSTGSVPSEVDKALKALEQVALPLATGLPLDAGIRLQRASQRLERLHQSGQGGVLAYFVTLLRLVQQELSPFALPHGGSKSKVQLTRSELERELEIIEWYQKTGRPETVLILLREWVINRVLLELQGQDHRLSPWLDYDNVRKHLERELGHLSRAKSKGESKKGGTGGSDQNSPPSTLPGLWDRLRRHRNLFAHGGFTKSGSTGVEETIHTTLAAVRQNKDNPEFWYIDPAALAARRQRPTRPDCDDDADDDGEEPYEDAQEVTGLKQAELAQAEVATAREQDRPTGSVLITPLGLSPGVLFSAVRHTAPEQVIVLTSKEGAALAQEALSRAGYAGVRHVLLVTDPHAGFEELAGIWRQVQTVLATALPKASVVVNYTGGTTVLQYMTSRLEEELRRRAHPIRRVAVVDRRPPEEQRANPYVVGELIELP